jgi:probable rRNA maturation factor
MSLVSLSDEAGLLPPEWHDTLIAAVDGVLSAELGPAAERCEAGIAVVDATTIAELNLRWMGEEGPTDVLSFPVDDPPAQQGDHPVALGDIIICPEATAPYGQNGVYGGVVLCAVHGALHLLGHDHATPAEEAAMFGLQELHVARVLPP